MRLFLSYAHDDYDPMVRRLKADLEGLGHEVWIDRERISDWQDPTHDSDWRSSVTRGVLGSDLVLSFASARALRDNGVCLDELQISACVKGALVQSVLLEPGASALVPPAASFRQFVDMGDWREKLTRGDDEFEAWYADRLAELTTRLDGEELRRYAAELEEVERLLDPGLSTAKQDALQAAGFVGRGWLAKEVDAWLDDGDASQVMLVTGTPGCGKSAFAAHELMYDCRVGAAVFCQYDNAAFNDIDGVARAAAFQLAARFPDYRTTLLETLRREEGHRARRDEPRDGGPFERYVEAISRNLIRGGRGNVVIVIDGLDEVAMEGSGPRAVNPLAEELGGLIREGGVPRFVRFLVTSRADAAVVDSLTMARRLDVDAHPEEGEADVRAYVEARVGREGPLCEEIAAGAETNFQYARVACDLAGHGAFEAAAVPRSLGGLYRLYLDRAFGEAGAQPDASAPSEKAPEVAGDASQEEANHKNARRDKGMRKNRKALCLIASMDEPVPRETLRRAMGWGRRDEGCFRRALGMFLSETPDGRVSLFHKSFSDWLWTDEADVYRCDPDEGRELALGACIASFRDDAGGMSRFEATNLLPLLRESGEAHADDLREALGSEGLAERLVELSGDGRLSERIRCRKEAVEIYRSLDKKESGAWLPNVALSCNDLARLLMETGRYGEAEGLLSEALGTFRSLAESDPRTHLPNVAMSCGNLASLLAEIGRLGEAEKLYREALGTYRSLADKEPGVWLSDVARSCMNLAWLLAKTGRYGEVEGLRREALETYRSLADKEPGAWLPDVAWACNDLAVLLSRTRCPKEAEGLRLRGARHLPLARGEGARGLAVRRGSVLQRTRRAPLGHRMPQGGRGALPRGARHLPLARGEGARGVAELCGLVLRRTRQAPLGHQTPQGGRGAPPRGARHLPLARGEGARGVAGLCGLVLRRSRPAPRGQRTPQGGRGAPPRGARDLPLARGEGAQSVAGLRGLVLPRPRRPYQPRSPRRGQGALSRSLRYLHGPPERTTRQVEPLDRAGEMADTNFGPDIREVLSRESCERISSGFRV